MRYIFGRFLHFPSERWDVHRLSLPSPRTFSQKPKDCICKLESPKAHSILKNATEMLILLCVGGRRVRYRRHRSSPRYRDGVGLNREWVLILFFHYLGILKLFVGMGVGELGILRGERHVGVIFFFFKTMLIWRWLDDLCWLGFQCGVLLDEKDRWRSLMIGAHDPTQLQTLSGLTDFKRMNLFVTRELP